MKFYFLLLHSINLKCITLNPDDDWLGIQNFLLHHSVDCMLQYLFRLHMYLPIKSIHGLASRSIMITHLFAQSLLFWLFIDSLIDSLVAFFGWNFPARVIPATLNVQVSILVGWNKCCYTKYIIKCC